MLNISFLLYIKTELWDLTVCTVVNGEKFQRRTMTLTLIRQCPLSRPAYPQTWYGVQLKLIWGRISSFWGKIFQFLG